MNIIKPVVALLTWVLAASMADAALVSHWKLNDDGSSQTAADALGVNPATLGATSNPETTDPTWSTAAALGTGALAFDATKGQFAAAPSSASLSPTTAITVSAWFERARTGVWEFIVGKGDGGSIASTSFWLDVRADNSPGVFLGEAPSGADHRIYATSYQITDTTTWHHLLGTWEKTTGVENLYVDGAVRASTNWSAGTITTNSFQMAIGALGVMPWGYYGGLIDDVGLWNDSLSDGKAKAVYWLGKSASAFAPGEDPLLGYDLGGANQLFALYDAGSGGGSLVYGGAKWQYATGLATELGKVKYGAGGNYLVRLDANGTGLIGIVPEPSALVLALSGGLCLVCLARRRWKRRIEGT